MFTRISSLTLAILLIVLLGSQSQPFGSHTNFYVLFGATIVLILATLILNFRRLNFTWPHLLLPTLYLCAMVSVFVVISGPNIRLAFLIFSGLVFYFLEMRLGRESHFLQNVYLASLFGWYLGLFAIQFYFNLNGAVLAILVFASTYLFAIQGFAGFTLPAKKYFYFIIALLCAEGAWGLTFWPTYFSINAVVLFCMFYLLWLFSFSAFFGKLSRAKIYWQVALVIIVLTISLTTTAWQSLR